MRSSVFTRASLTDTVAALHRHALDAVNLEAEEADGIFEGFPTAVDIYTMRDDAEEALIDVLRSEGIEARSSRDLERESVAD